MTLIRILMHKVGGEGKKVKKKSHQKVVFSPTFLAFFTQKSSEWKAQKAIFGHSATTGGRWEL